MGENKDKQSGDKGDTKDREEQPAPKPPDGTVYFAEESSEGIVTFEFELDDDLKIKVSNTHPPPEPPKPKTGK